MANAITCFRIVCSLILLCFAPLSPGFYIFYMLAGFSDMADGFVARKSGTESQLGARLDSIADIVLVSVCLVKLLPELYIPFWLWLWMGTIALIKLINVVCGFVFRGKLIFLHTRANKMTGLFLFVLPFTLPRVSIIYSAPFICALASFAAIQECCLMKTGREE